MKTMYFVHLLSVVAAWKARGVSRRGAIERVLVKAVFAGWPLALCGRCLRVVYGGAHV